MIAKNGRANCVAEHITVGEEPTTCVHCGARTNLIATKEDGERVEICIHCGQLYYVSDDDEPEADPDDDGEAEQEDEPKPPMSDLDRILKEFSFEPDEMSIKEASQADLDHLFGLPRRKEPDGWGSF